MYFIVSLPTMRLRGGQLITTSFHDGRPTRAARVLYICRGINHGPFTDFISADVKANIECINLFQRGTHELLITFSEHQIKTLVVRTESLLRFLLLTHLATK